MKNNNRFWFALLSMLTITSLVGCAKDKGTVNSSSSVDTSSDSSYSEPEPEPEPEPDPEPLEIGDTVKEWTCRIDFDGLPMDTPSNINGTRTIDDTFGINDEESLSYEVYGGSTGSSYIGTDNVEEAYFTDDDAKNGDIISMWLYLPEGNNLETVELQLMHGNNAAISGGVIEVDEEQEEKWFRVSAVLDTLDVLKAIHLNYKPLDNNEPVTLFIDNIEIILGEETQTTGYVSNEESLYQTYEEYFKVGACMSANMLGNTKMRQIAKEQFNSLTAENESKPERVLDQAACQALAQSGQKGQVAITTAPFEKLYDFCEAHHIAVRHHTLVWYSQTPDWFFKEDYTSSGTYCSKQLMLERMENFISETLITVNDRWPGLVYAIDVVNEALENGGAGYNKNNKWYDTIGDGFVCKALEFAYKYKEDYQDVYYNDYACDYRPEQCDFALNTMLKDAIDGGYIDGFGLQGHIDADNTRHLLTDAKKIYEKGLKCQITELDITVNSTSESDFNKQKNAYKELVKGILQGNLDEEMDVNAIVVWGITDDTSWKRNQNPLLFTSNYEKKPAYYGFLEAIEEVE